MPAKQKTPKPMITQHQMMDCKVEIPMRGGVDTIGGVDVAWTGGDPYNNAITAPAAYGCYRPMEPDKARKVEDKCVLPLPESRRLQVISSSVTQKHVLLI